MMRTALTFCLMRAQKSKIVDEVLKLSGFDGEDIVDEEDYIKTDRSQSVNAEFV